MKRICRNIDGWSFRPWPLPLSWYKYLLEVRRFFVLTRNKKCSCGNSNWQINCLCCALMFAKAYKGKRRTSRVRDSQLPQGSLSLQEQSESDFLPYHCIHMFTVLPWSRNNWIHLNTRCWVLRRSSCSSTYNPLPNPLRTSQLSGQAYYKSILFDCLPLAF